MITQERMLMVFKRTLKAFGDDPYMENFRVSYKLNDVEVYSKEFSKNDYENNSIEFSRIYSDIEQRRKNKMLNSKKDL